MDHSMNLTELERLLGESVAIHGDPALSPLTARWKMALVDSDFTHGRFTFSFRLKADMCNPLGTIHGGVTAGLLDTAMGTVVRCYTRQGQPAVTVELNVSYLLPALPETDLNASVTVLRAGGHLIVLKADLFFPASPETILVSARGTFYAK